MNNIKQTIAIAATILGIMTVQCQALTIWHVTDIHVMAPEVCKNRGKAWEKYNIQLPQLDFESPVLLQAIIDSALIYKPDIVIISGDLTKSGERPSHELVAKMLKPLMESNDIKTYVIPGNHDLYNPTAYIFDGDEVKRDPGITEDEFRQLYYHFDEADAVRYDKTTLSYIAYPNDELALLCMDSNDWSTATWNGTETPDTIDNVSCPGKYSEATLQWMESEAKAAIASGRRVFVVQHQTLFEHFDNESALLSSNLINPKDSIITRDVIIQRMADAGIEVVFSGHRHFTDINYMITETGQKVWEVNTGSASHIRPQYRVCSLDNNKLNVSTVVIRNVDLDGKGTPTDEYASKMLYDTRKEFCRSICFTIWPSVQKVFTEFTAVPFQLNLPSTFDQFRDMIERHFADDITKMYLDFAIGNEHLNDYTEFIDKVQDDIDAAILEICYDNENLKSAMMALLPLLLDGLDIATIAKDYLASPFGNYLSANGGEIIDDQNCIIPLAAPHGIEDGIVEHKSQNDKTGDAITGNTAIYDLSGRKINAQSLPHGIYIVAGRKIIK